MRRNLLLASAACLFSVCAIAQQDYAPLNWKFSQMEIGSAESLFIREMASSNWGMAVKVFRYGDNLQGAVGLACEGIGTITDDFTKFTDEQKDTFEKFYNSCQIVDGGALGHLFCYQGSSSDVVDARITKNTVNMGHATLFWLSDTNIPVGKNYRLTFSWRVASKVNDKMKVSIATSAYDGIDTAPGYLAGTDGYRNYELTYYSNLPNDWAISSMDITIEDNKAADYKELPLVIKLWLGDGIEQGLLFLRDIKLEAIDAVDMKNIPGHSEYPEDWDDTPTGISTPTLDNQAIVWAKDGVITVVDAVSPVAIYSVTGQLLSIKAPIGNITTIPMNKKGTYIVKIGDSCRKVVL